MSKFAKFTRAVEHKSPEDAELWPRKSDFRLPPRKHYPLPKSVEQVAKEISKEIADAKAAAKARRAREEAEFDRQDALRKCERLEKAGKERRRKLLEKLRNKQAIIERQLEGHESWLLSYADQKCIEREQRKAQARRWAVADARRAREREQREASDTLNSWLQEGASHHHWKTS